MSQISTHVLDTSQGRPGKGVPVTLERRTARAWEVVGQGVTDAAGRLKDLLPSNSALRAGTYRLTFDTHSYFSAQQVDSFYPSVTVVFTVHDATQHYHVPLLLSPFGYSTYRGS